MRLALLLSAAFIPFAASAQAAELADVSALAPDSAEDQAAEPIIVTAARTNLPVTALPLTADVIDRETLERQLQISGSVVDAVAALTPASHPRARN